ncbi:MAG: hypothetical protein ACD_45C00004G0004 [uncultured bacterium]|nr:MAG: hypothetical protein ACD_45C00004G0004 [uncultured bacterium]
MYRVLIMGALFSTILTGCMVGPNFHSPKPPNVRTYTASPLPKKTLSTPAAGMSGRAQRFVQGKDVPAEWWFLFHSPVINDLIQVGLANSPNLAAAKATLRQAQETLNAEIGGSLLPAVSTELTGQRQRASSASSGIGGVTSLFNLYNASVDVSYTFDMFGGARRQIEALGAQVDFERFELEAANLTLTSNIVTTSITVASLEAQIQATQELIQLQTDLLVIVKQQYHAGGVSRANVLSQESQLAQTKASLPPLKQSLAQANHALAVLVGDFPSEMQLPTLKLATLTLPDRLPVSLPSTLVRQRPDVRAAEATLATASAQIGVATANLLPQITLNGSYGWSNTGLRNLINPSNNVWNAGGSLLQPLFNGGALLAKRRAAIAGYEEAQAQYRQTVLQAFQNVADTLRALQHDAETLRAQEEAEMAAERSLILTKDQFRAGGVNYLNLLNAELQYQQAKINRIQAQAARYSDTAALFQALGGGWWNRSEYRCCLSRYTKTVS